MSVLYRSYSRDFFGDADVCGMTPLARLLFLAVMLEADREGRLVLKPRTFKLRYFPADTCDVDLLIDELAAAGLLVPYVIEGVEYAAIPSFAQRQVINNRESASMLPACSTDAIPTCPPRVATREHASVVVECNVCSVDASPATASAAPTASKKSAKATRLSENWSLPKAWGEWALTEKPVWTDEDARQCALRFADYWHAKAGKDATKLDWLATWRNWVRSERGPSAANCASGGEAWTPPSIR